MKIGKITDTQNNVRETGWEFQSNAMNIRKMKNSGSNIEQSIILVVLIYLEKVISVDDTISILHFLLMKFISLIPDSHIFHIRIYIPNIN